MANILNPDKIRSEKIGNGTIIVKEKIIPDSARATKYVASYVQKGEPMKPLLSLHGDGKPQGITVHNTPDISVPDGTTPAEQYTRATWPNQNMAGVCVHFYVYKSDIWQNLRETEQGWHATDGASRRASQRKGQTIGGNLDTVAIECIGKDAASEDTTAKLAAYLLQKYNLSPDTDVYQHNYFYPSKNCPEYIRPHWSTFLTAVKQYYGVGSVAAAPEEPTVTIETPSAEIKVGDIVQFSGGYHYASSDAVKASGAKRTAGKAKVSAVSAKALHPYHLIGQSGGSNVYGWVNPADIAGADSAGTVSGGTSNAVKVGATVRVKNGAKSYEGKAIAAFVYQGKYRVDALTGDRAVLDKKGVCTAFKTADLEVITV